MYEQTRPDLDAKRYSHFFSNMSGKSEKELSVILNPERPFYLSGDPFEGCVRYDCSENRSVRRIEIKFSGRLKSAIVEKHPLATIYTTYRDRVWLFEESQNLLSGDDTTLEPGSHIWPFSFTIPTSVTPRKLKSWDVGPALERFPEQMLPPSFHLNARVKGLISGHYSITSYALVATLHFTDAALPTQDAALPINILPVSATPPPTSEHQHQATHEARGFDLLPPHSCPENTNGLHQLLKPKPPTLRLRLTATHPVYLIPTHPLPLSVTLAVLPPRPHDTPFPTAPTTPPPTFLVKSVRARIKSKTTIAITRTAEHSRTHSATVHDVRLYDQGALVPGEEKEVAMGALGYVPASVHLSSLSRRYVMRVEVVVGMAGGERAFEVKGEAPVVVEALPEEAREEGRAAEMVKGGMAAAALEDVGGVLDVGLGVLGLVTL